MRSIPFWLVLIVLLTSCDAGFGRRYQNLASTPALNPQHSRITLTNFDTYPVHGWQVSAVGFYDPTSKLTEENTVTTSSRANCGGGRFSVNVLPCKGTFIKPLDRRLSKRQVSINQAGQLVIDFPPDEQEGESTYFIREIYVSLIKCADCNKETFTIRLNCYQEDISPEILQNKLSMQMSHGANVSAKAKLCGLNNETYSGRFTRDTALKVIKGHFNQNDRVNSYELLNTFFAIPTKQGDWIVNRSHVGESMHEYCPLPEISSGYDRTDLNTKLGPKVGWPYNPKVEMIIYRLPYEGGLCQIGINGTAQVRDLTPSVSHTYIFKQGQLAMFKTEEADDTERWLRFENGEPLEYLSKHDPDSVAGGEDMVYWHRDAAKEWPERMDFTPDWKEFAHAKKVAEQLMKAYVTPLPKPAAAKP